MRDIAAAALAATPDGPPLRLARAVRLQGFGSRRPDQAALFSAAGVAGGALLGGAADDRIAASDAPFALLEVAIGDGPAVAAGLACGGSASIAVQDLTLVPAAWWQALLDREPATLVTSLASGESTVVTGPGVGRDAGARIEGDEIVEVWWPTPRLAVLGAADLAGALRRQAQLLGWEVDLEPAGGGDLGPTDALVALTHDHDLATPALAAALTGRAGFVGALGSRRTQAERRERLTAAGVTPADVARLHGPVGLDLGARSPEEQALAICAEIVAVRSGRNAGSLTTATGPING